MNRADRRRVARQNGISPADLRRAQHADRVAAKLEAKVLKMQPAEARRLLAEWAAKGGATQADVDLLNGVAGRRGF